MNNQLANYFKNFNEQLTDDLGSRFDYLTLINYGKRKKQNLSIEESGFDILWIEEVEAVVEKIKTIVNNINPNIDPADFINSKYNTFEDRYIVFLIDELSSLLASTSSNLASSTKRLADYYINHQIPFSEYSKLKDVKVLANNNKLFLKEERKLLQVREAIGNLMETNYYNCLKNSIHFDEGCVCINGVIAKDPLYGSCYDFYKRLVEIKSIHQELPEAIRDIDYHNYVLLNLLLSLDNAGFSINGTSPEFDNKDYLLRVKNLKLGRNNFLINITSENDDHIDLLIENNDDSKEKYKKTSKISIDLLPSLSKEITSKEEAISYSNKKTNSRINKGYDNAFMITSIKEAQNDNLIISSPLDNPFDANLKNMIEGLLVIIEANQFTYSHFCPICGGHVENENNNYHCSVCDSKYMLYSKKDQKEMVWLKRVKNLEGK